TNTDCDDGNASVHPGAAETCNGVDDNCSGAIDEGLQCSTDAGAVSGGDGASDAGDTDARTVPEAGSDASASMDAARVDGASPGPRPSTEDGGSANAPLATPGGNDTNDAKGCGCRGVGSTGSRGGSFGFAVLLGLVAARQRGAARRRNRRGR